MKIFQGHSASPGLAAGVAFWINHENFVVPHRKITRAQVRQEMERLRLASRNSDQELRDLSSKISGRQASGFKDIFGAYSLILHDPAILSRIEDLIRRERICADWAVERVYDDVAGVFARMKNRHLAARREDVDDVKRFIIDHLATHRPSRSANGPRLPSVPFIAVAHEITPAKTSALLASRVVGLVTRLGGRTSHVAIIAREIGIPLVFGLPARELGWIQNNDNLLIDGATAKIVLNPTPAATRAFRGRLTAFRRFQRVQLRASQTPASTRDGAEVHLRANIEAEQDVPLAKNYGACGVGLFRTEYLYLGDKFPGEEDLVRAYRRAARETAPYQLVVRTMDLGGDKFLSRIDFPSEINPMLGMRAIRLCLAQPGLLLPQLAAACRANTSGNIKLCLPMVSTVEEVVEVRRHLDRVIARLRRRCVPFRVPPLGMMVEVPSVALRLEPFLPHSEFFSIGTNDLLQYTLAVSRTQDQLAHLYRPLNPSFLWLLERVVKTCDEAQKQVTLCGEEAHNPLLIPFLLGIGLRDLSMAPPALPDIKKLICGLDLARCRVITRDMLELSTTGEVEQYVRREVYPMLKVIIPQHYSYIPLESEL